MFRASRGDHKSVLEFFTYFRGLCYSSGRAITGLSQSEDLRHLSVCREREISHREKRDGTQTIVTPESRPFQGNSTRNFFLCTPVHVLNHTSEEITIFAPKSFGQLNMRCCTILHGLTLSLRPRTSSLLTRTTVRRSKVLWMSSEVSLYKCTFTHNTHTHTQRGLQPWILHATVDITLQRFHGWTWTVCVCVWMDCLCMCVKFNYLTMVYPLPLPKSIIGHFFLICMPMRFATKWRVSDNRGRPRLVDTHNTHKICHTHTSCW